MLLDTTCLALDNDLSDRLCLCHQVGVNIMAPKIHPLLYTGINQRPL
jgi:hypothetical protein